ncbi:MAG: hypothetical protein ACM3OC_06065 [Deltaproteobacteria bacterium]
MKKRTKIIIISAAAVVAVVFMLKDMIARSMVTAGFTAVTGAPMEMKKFSFSVLRSRVEAGDVRIYNPPGFTDTDRLMADIPSLALAVDVGSVFSGKPHILELKLDLAALVIVRNRKATLNIDSLRALQPKGGGKPPPMTIDLVQLSIGKLIYRDFALGSPLERTFELEINEKFADITNPYSLVNAILARALSSANLEQIAGIDMDKLNSDLDRSIASTRNKFRESLQKQGDKSLQKYRDQLGNFSFPR